MRITVKNIARIGIIMLISFQLTGCGSTKSVNYNIDIENSDDDNLNAQGISQYKDISGWRDSWGININDGTTITVNMNASVVVPDIEQMTYVEAEYFQYDMESKEKIARTLFGDEDIYYYDEVRRPKDELEASIKILQFKVEECDRLIDSNFEVPYWTQKKEEFLSLIKECKAALPNADNSYKLVTEYDGSQYIGEINGEQYLLEFLDNYKFVDFQPGIDRVVKFYPKNRNGNIDSIYSSGDFYSTDILPATEIDDNACRYSSDDAVQLADRCIENMGYSGYTLCDTYNLEWYSNIYDNPSPEKIENNGYVFIYGQPIDNSNQIYPDNFNSVDISINGLLEYPNRSGTQQLAVVVTDNGISGVCVDNAMKITMSGDAKMLSFDSIKGIIKDVIESRSELYDRKLLCQGNILEYKFLRLEYMQVNRDDGIALAYVPVWHLVTYTDSLDYINDIYDVYINAIDGTNIDRNNLLQNT